jgi:hypothetical protein
MMVVADKTPENDCATAIACGVAFSVGLSLFMLGDDRSVLERASVTGNSSLNCSDRVIVTKEVTVDEANGLEDVTIEFGVEVLELVRITEVLAACTEDVKSSLDGDGVDAGLSTSGAGGGNCRGGNAGAGGVGAEGGARSPIIGFAWFCPGRGRFTVMAGAPDAVRVAVATDNAGFGTSPIFEVSWLIPGRV